MRKSKILRFIPVLFIFIYIIGSVPVSAAKKKKPGQPKISAEVTNVLEEWVEITVKIDETADADGFEIYRKVTGQQNYLNIRTLEESGDEEREVVITCGFDCKNAAIRVRAYNDYSWKGRKYGKYSNVVKIKISDYKGKAGKPVSKSTKSDKTDMSLNIEVDRTDSNNIGNEWLYEYKVNDEKVKTSGSSYSLSVGDKITVYSKITENDKKPDIGEASKTYTVTENDLKNGFKIAIDVKVTENAGRYVGKSATYKVYFKFKKS